MKSENKKINLLMMIDDAELGGGQVHLLSLVRGINRDVFTVTVACAGSGWLVDELRRINIPLLEININNSLNIRSFFHIYKLLKSGSFDIIHTHGGTAGFYGRLTARFNKGIKAIHTYHGIHYLNEQISFKKKIFKWIDRFLLKYTDKTICVAESDKIAGISSGIVNEKKNITIFNGVDTNKFILKSNRTEQGIVIGSIGRLHIQKGYEYLLYASNIVKKKYPNVIFKVAGDGELRKALESLRNDLGLKGSFEFTGSTNDVPLFLSGIDVFVLPSLWEGLPLVLLEAMSAMKPIIATEVNGNIELIENQKDGLLVPPKSSEKLAEAICLLIENRNLRNLYSEKAYKKVLEKFSLKSMIDKTTEVYMQVLKKEKSDG